ncbi:UNVERIFIED_CONTAM: hypothetical protein GTU68_000452, partial [Idotea baltica]|nr:hypothetical protein [Idotea baltica]
MERQGWRHRQGRRHAGGTGNRQGRAGSARAGRRHRREDHCRNRRHRRAGRPAVPNRSVRCRRRAGRRGPGRIRAGTRRKHRLVHAAGTVGPEDDGGKQPVRRSGSGRHSPWPRGRRRRSPRRARAHDQAAPDHRAPPEGRPEHRRHADHLQRGGHGAGDGAAQTVQGSLREEAWRQAWLHGLLHQGGDACPERGPGSQCRNRRQRHHLQELLPRRRGRRHRQGPGRS